MAEGHLELHGFSGEGTLASAQGHLALAGGITLASTSTLALGDATFAAYVNVVNPSITDQLQAYFNSLTVTDLIALLAMCWQCLNATLDDPERGMYTTLFLLPTTVLILRALRNKR